MHDCAWPFHMLPYVIAVPCTLENRCLESAAQHFSFWLLQPGFLEAHLVLGPNFQQQLQLSTLLLI